MWHLPSPAIHQYGGSRNGVKAGRKRPAAERSYNAGGEIPGSQPGWRLFWPAIFLASKLSGPNGYWRNRLFISLRRSQPLFAINTVVAICLFSGSRRLSEIPRSG